MKYYSQVDKDHRIKAAAVIDALVSKGESDCKDLEKTDAGD